jgi:hypothetical protein
MGDALEASPQRILDHLRRPVPGRRDLLTNNAGNTVNEIVPWLTIYQGQAGADLWGADLCGADLWSDT